MDPSKQQADSENDIHSLETSSDTMPENTAPTPGTENTKDTINVSDAAGDISPTPSPDMPKKLPFFKRIWQKFNIYLLLFVLVIVIAIAVVVVLTINERKAAKQATQTLSSQSLSENTFKQLADSTSTVGSSQQTLTVQSNAVFAGTVLVRSNLAVAGTLQIGGDLVLPGITVSGNSRFGQVQADSITIANAANVQGVLTAKNGLSVTGNSTFNGAISTAQLTTGTLQLNGDLVLTHHITAGGAVPGFSKGSALGSGGTSSVSGSDTSGTIIINTGSGAPAGCFATVNFSKAFSGTPHVLVTPVGSSAAGIAYYVNRSSTSFSLCSTTPPPSGVSFGFDYFVLD